MGKAEPEDDLDDNVTSVSFTLWLPEKLRERARKVARRCRTNTAQLVREALRDKIDFLEARERVAVERDVEDRDARRMERNTRRLSRAESLAPRPVEPPEPPPRNPDRSAALKRAEEICRRRAADAARARDATERRLIEEETVEEVKRDMPLRYPPEGEIREIFDRLVSRERARLQPRGREPLDEIEPLPLRFRHSDDESDDER